jgi:hypothetical protein
MKRLLLVASLLLSSAFAQDSGLRVLDGKSYHLGAAGMPEWEEFERSTPHGPQLELRFNATANASESTLLIRQRNVKTTWNVTLNGQKIGTLETLVQPLVRALTIPAGALKSGENRLLIARPPSRFLDDIVVGEITLSPRPPSETFGQAALDVSVTDADTKQELPCRLTLVDAEAALAPLHAVEPHRLAVRTGVVYTPDGKARLGVRPGTYVLYANRGFEYGVATQRIVIGAGEKQRIALQIRREVPTPGLVACDTHIHTLTYSKHGDATIDERMLTIAGEGIEFAVATDHNHHVDYSEAAARMGVNPHFRSVVGNEVSTKAGHFNAFPARPDGPVPNAQLTNWNELLDNIRSVTGAKVVTLNHPRDAHYNFTPLGPANFDARTGEFKGEPRFDVDAIEVVTSAAIQSDVMQLYRDWFALLNRGLPVAAIGASDTHHVSEFILGQSRTYAASRASEPSAIDVAEVCESYRAGRLLVSMGLLTNMKVDGRFGVGDLATKLGKEIGVAIEVLGPSWTNADRLELFANGIKIREHAIAPTTATRKAQVNWSIPRPKHDVHLVAIATGPGIVAPFWEISLPYQPTSRVVNPRVVGSTNPIWIDADGNGRFDAARTYARTIVHNAAGDATKLKAAMQGYDEAVALHVQDLVQAQANR